MYGIDMMKDNPEFVGSAQNEDMAKTPRLHTYYAQAGRICPLRSRLRDARRLRYLSLLRNLWNGNFHDVGP
jgi:hypothetical protein